MVRPLPVLLLAAVLAGCGASPAVPRVAAARLANPTLAAQAVTPAAVNAPAYQAAAPAASPAAQAQAPAAQALAGVPFSVLTYNTWGKPGFLGTDLKRRFGLIGPAVAGH